MSFPLTADQLFTPAPSGVLAAQPGAPPAPGTWLAQILTNATILGLATTAWQSGQPARTINAIMAVLQSQQDGVISAMNQAGFLDFAASGTVTILDLNGNPVTTPVTPDPTIPAQVPKTGWVPGFLDALADSQYDVQRISATYAGGELYVANTSGSTYNFTAGTWHVQNGNLTTKQGTGATYANDSTISITPTGIAGTGGTVTGATNASPIQITTQSAHGLSSGDVIYIAGLVGNTAANPGGPYQSNGFWSVTVTGADTFTLNGSSGNGVWTAGGQVYTTLAIAVAADLIGAQGSAVPNAVQTLVTQSTGVVIDNLSPFIGAPFEGNVPLAGRCREKLATFSPNGPGQACVFFAKTAATVLAELPNPAQLTSPITRAIEAVDPTSGTVITTVANAAGAVAGLVGGTALVVTNASNASPIQITTSTPHGLTTGMFVWVSAVGGNTAANGVWAVTNIDGTNFTLNGSSGNGAYTGSTGTVETQDLGLVDYVIHAQCAPDGITATTQSVLTETFRVWATVTVPANLVAAYTAAVANALPIYYANLPIGGVSEGGAAGFFQLDALIGFLWNLGTANGQNYIIGMTGAALDTGGGPVAADVVYTGADYVAVLPTSLPFGNITVVGQ